MTENEQIAYSAILKTITETMLDNENMRLNDIKTAFSNIQKDLANMLS